MNSLEHSYTGFPCYQDRSFTPDAADMTEGQLPLIPNEVNQTIRERLLSRCTKGIITLDIDDTLVRGPEMIETSNTIRDAIDRVKKSGYLVSFSSLRCINKTTLDLHTKYKLNGPIFAEYGDVVAFPDPKMPVIVIHNEEAYTATKQLRLELGKWVNHQGDLFDYREFHDKDPDTTFLEYKNNAWPNAGKLSIWVDYQRLCGLAIWPFRQPVENELPPTSKSLYYDNFFDGLSEYTYLRGLNTLKFHRLSTSLPVIIAKSNKNSKTEAWRQFSSFIGHDHIQRLKCFHIGDSPADKIFYDGVTTIAVENAHQSLKDHAGYITPGSYTQGVVEGLNYILDQE